MKKTDVLIGKNYESVKSHTSTVSHGSTGSKMSSTSSQLSAQGWSGPRDMEVPDTEDPDVLRNLEFVSPKVCTSKINSKPSSHTNIKW